MQRRNNYYNDRSRTGSVKTPKGYNSTYNQIDVGNRPVPSMKRGASNLSDQDFYATGSDYNSNPMRRSTNRKNLTYGSAELGNGLGMPVKMTPCRKCGRSFAPNRITVHERTCTATGPARLTPSQSQGMPNTSSSRTQGDRNGMSQSGPKVRQSRQPKFVFCYICGRQFTDASLPIHEPQCMQKWEVQNNQLPPSERRPRPKKPEILTGGKGGGMTREELQEAQWEAAKANLVPCRNCGRRFAQDRIGVHERICKGLKNGPPAPATATSTQFDDHGDRDGDVGGGRNKTMTRSVPNDYGSSKPKPSGGGVRQSRQPKFVFCYICGRQFTDASLPIHEPQCMQKWEVQNNQLPPSERRPRPKKPEILTGGKGGGMTREQLQEAQWQAAKANLVECRNCGRRFATDRIGVHERICKGLKNGPPPGVGTNSNDSREDGPNARNATTSRPAVNHDPEPSRGSYKIPTKPRTVVCYLCGREFGSKSIDIHEPQCLQKWHFENDKLPPHQRRPEPTKPKAIPISGRGGGYDMTAMNQAALQTAMDSRVPCSNCGRKFNPDRVAIHERSCRPKVQYD